MALRLYISDNQCLKSYNEYQPYAVRVREFAK